MSKDKLSKLLQAKSNKLQPNNGVQILPGSSTLKEQLASSPKLVGCEFINIHQKIYICI